MGSAAVLLVGVEDGDDSAEAAARCLRAKAWRPKPCCHPIDLVISSGREACGRARWEPMLPTTARRVSFRVSRRPRVMGGRVFRKLGWSVALERYGGDASHDTALDIAAELALPSEIARSCGSLAEAMALQPYADLALLRLQLARVGVIPGV